MIRTFPIRKADRLPLDFDGAEAKLDRLSDRDLDSCLRDYTLLLSNADDRKARLELLAADLQLLAGWIDDPSGSGEVLDEQGHWVVQLEKNGNDGWDARGPYEANSADQLRTPYWVVARLATTGALNFVGLTKRAE